MAYFTNFGARGIKFLANVPGPVINEALSNAYCATQGWKVSLNDTSTILFLLNRPQNMGSASGGMVEWITVSPYSISTDSAGICGHGVQPDMEVEMSKLCSQF